MMLYFEFEEKRRKADVIWSKNKENIIVHVTDTELARDLPADLFFEVEEKRKVVFIEENPANKRLLELQNVLAKRLQELANR